MLLLSPFRPRLEYCGICCPRRRNLLLLPLNIPISIPNWHKFECLTKWNVHHVTRNDCLTINKFILNVRFKSTIPLGRRLNYKFKFWIRERGKTGKKNSVISIVKLTFSGYGRVRKLEFHISMCLHLKRQNLLKPVNLKKIVVEITNEG